MTEKVCSYALSLAKKYGAKVDIIYIIQEPANLIGLLSFDAMEKEITEAAGEKLEMFCNNH